MSRVNPSDSYTYLELFSFTLQSVNIYGELTDGLTDEERLTKSSKSTCEADARLRAFRYLSADDACA